MNILALFIYRIVLILLLPVILLAALIRSFKNKAYRQRLNERLGIITQRIQTGGIIIHAASVGEVLALKPFIEHCLSQFHQLPITVTTFTPTGSAQVKKLFSKKVQHCYLPLDIWPCTSFFLYKFKPKAIVVMETELWPNLAAQAHNKNIKQLLINGRISDSSFGNYQRLSALIAPCLKAFDQVLAQSQTNADRLIALGAPTAKCQVAGNLKYDLSISADVVAKQQQLAEFLPTSRPCWLLASSHDGDEKLILTAFQQVLNTTPETLLIIVPRHPERFNAVEHLIKQQNFRYQKRSNEQSVTSDTQVWLMDSLGELMAAYHFATVVTIGGTFSTIGGHNPLEPALYKKPIIVGDDMANFKEIAQLLSEHNAMLTLPTSDIVEISNTLASRVTKLINSPELAQTLGTNAYNIVKQNQGSSLKAIQALRNLLNL
ncbi:lipid IV(A) 3-deoxy-D-manno-octulosonic acid transferase [Colwellia sp. MEBiC06753]